MPGRGLLRLIGWGPPPPPPVTLAAAERTVNDFLAGFGGGTVPMTGRLARDRQNRTVWQFTDTGRKEGTVGGGLKIEVDGAGGYLSSVMFERY